MLYSCDFSDLQHLDESDTKVEICHVAAYQGQAEEGADGEDGAHVDFASHLDRLATIKEGSGSGHYLGHYCSEGQMPTSEYDGVIYSRRSVRPTFPRVDSSTHGIRHHQESIC